jgi:hypothetical protein
MSTKLSSGKMQPKQAPIQEASLMLALETAVLALESNGMDEHTIHGMVNCILKGFITNGTFAPEYIEHVENIIKEKQELARQEEFRKAFGSGSSLSSS